MIGTNEVLNRISAENIAVNLLKCQRFYSLVNTESLQIVANITDTKLLQISKICLSTIQVIFYQLVNNHIGQYVVKHVDVLKMIIIIRYSTPSFSLSFTPPVFPPSTCMSIYTRMCLSCWKRDSPSGKSVRVSFTDDILPVAARPASQMLSSQVAVLTHSEGLWQVTPGLPDYWLALRAGIKTGTRDRHTGLENKGLKNKKGTCFLVEIGGL